MKQISAWMILLAVLFAACHNSAPLPKPHGYLRTDFPEKKDRLFDSTGYPYRFSYPDYARMVPDKQSYRYEPYWVNLQMPAYNATIHISYKRVRNNLPELLDDTYTFVYRHVIKADEIVETPVRNEEQRSYGFLYEIGGDVASSVQFYVTDSIRHFLRGSLYFMSTPNMDSLAPSIAFLTADIQHLMQTLEWKKQ
ncbi:MAG: gliding motility lipoprotein GldD [Dysgonamonadaceae bacterium]|jgi:gliding motility-associated lipoprotein GldD|nr:gliding motility lipoprotein GldD [Dysgonamonadaceae bacterium]